MKTYKIYASGRFIETDKELHVINPFSQQIEAKTFLANLEVLENAIKSALTVEDAMKNLTIFIRHAILNDIAENILERKQEMAQVLSMEAGKPIRYALAEIERAAQTFKVAAEECKRLPGEYLSIDWTKDAINKEAIVKYFPVGLVAGISPFNFPLNLAAHKIAPAIAAGCPIILKPASNTPLSTLLLAEIIDKTDLPKGAFSVLPMDRTTGNVLVTDERFKLLTFTGSPEVGWAMKKNAGKKKVVLELGGNAGVIVCRSADISLAAKRCLVGAFAYSGQICIHAQRLFIHESVYDKFIEAFLPLVSELKFGDTADPQTDFSVMIDEKNAQRVEAWINEAVSGGAEVLCGGKRKGNFIEPTVIAAVHKDMKVCYEEVFGPVVTVSKFSTIEEAVDSVNYGKFGLQAGIFTNGIDEMNYAFNNLEVGGVIVNDVPTFRVDHMPYGGVKDSGLGREGVKYAIHDMMEAKVLVKNIL